MPLDGIRVIAWDFDGVLNSNFQNGKLVWSQNFERDLDLPLRSFAQFLFKGRFQRAMIGAGDLRQYVRDWLILHETAHTADDILAYWFARDALPNQQMLGYLEQMSRRDLINIIATNNEILRAHYIEHDMGIGAWVDHFFAAGRMQIAKPDISYFRHIEAALDLPPSAFLLIDDLSENVDAARQSGWQAHHFRAEDYTALERVLDL
ncbi:MAG: HAD-IA family hydrolase [Henriciella sp.]|nr:HAD-IA family hydrolase [Henriciella sp.]